MTIENRPSRLHHYAFLTNDQEATRAFYEDLIGLPLVATWSEADEIQGAHREYCHTFFALGDGSALAFFQFADAADQKQFNPDYVPTPLRHIALNVTSDVQSAIHDRLTGADWKPAARVRDHGYCRSLYTVDPNGLNLEFTVDADNADQIARDRTADAHDTLKAWLAGDRTSNNTYR